MRSSAFWTRTCCPRCKEAFKQYKSADKTVLQAELEKLVANIQNAGMNPDESPKVKELRQRIADSAVDVTALENEVFSHLFNFFRRYYSEGDFISLRRYKEGVYAIPYEGEEVKLHWANADQYYVKSSETFGTTPSRSPGASESGCISWPLHRTGQQQGRTGQRTPLRPGRQSALRGERRTLHPLRVPPRSKARKSRTT